MYGLADHPAGQAAAREQQRQGGRLDPSALDETLRLGDVPKGTRRLVVREYSQIVSPDPAPGAPERAPEAGGEGVTGLVDALDKLDQVQRRRAADETGPDEIASAVAQAVAEPMEQVAQAIALMADRDDDETSEVRELREELAALREEQRQDELDALRERIDAMAVEEGSLPADALGDPDVAREYMAHRAAQDGINQLADVINEKFPAPESWGELMHEWRWASQYAAPPPGTHAPGRPTPPGYTPPGERETEAGAGRERPEGSVTSVRPSEPQEAASTEPDGGHRAEGSDGAGELLERLEQAEAVEQWLCGVCGHKWESPTVEDCPECGDASPSRV